MTDNLPRAKPDGSFIEFLKDLNVPHLLAGPAGKAVSRLIGGAVDIPAAHLDGFAQEVKSKTEGRKIVSEALARKAAELVVADDEIVARAMRTFVAKEYRRQGNREKVAQATLLELRDQSKRLEDQSGKDATSDIDDDWMNIFERYAEDASSEKVQTLWGRVLAGEIRKPKTFSLKTLRFIAELDQETAALFEKYAPYIVNGDHIQIHQRLTEGEKFDDFLRLEDAGLIRGASDGLAKAFTMAPPKRNKFVVQNRDVLFLGKSWSILNVESVLLTRIGIELTKIVDLPYDKNVLNEVVAAFPKDKLEFMVIIGNDYGPFETITGVYKPPIQNPSEHRRPLAEP